MNSLQYCAPQNFIVNELHVIDYLQSTPHHSNSKVISRYMYPEACWNGKNVTSDIL